MVHLSFFAAPVIVLLLAVPEALNEQARENGMHVFFASLAAFFGLLSACCYLWFRRYMPFAAANLRAAMSAIRANQGLLIVSLANGPLSVIWLLVWMLAFLGVFHYVHVNEPQDQQPNGAIVLAFLLCLYWTHQVLQNVLHVTTAGTVGMWWFTDSSSMDSRAGSRGWGLGDVLDSLYRSLTYSFGSICMGSLLVALMETLENMLGNARRNRRGSTLLLCALECLVHLLRRWIHYFNSWAFVYVGLYGYDYLAAGKNVVSLFRSTGWMTFIADRLVFRVIFFCHLNTAIVTGYGAVLMDRIVGPVFDEDDFSSHFLAFFYGLLLGFFISSTALFVVESAVRTVIVCFAESPAEFQMYHPDLCNELTQSWSETYPEAWEGRHRQSDVPVMAVALVSNDDDEVVRLVA